VTLVVRHGSFSDRIHLKANRERGSPVAGRSPACLEVSTALPAPASEHSVRVLNR
jgi:hypothetical protein